MPAEPADRRGDPTAPPAGADDVTGADAPALAEPVAEVEASEDEVVESKARSERTPKDMAISLLVLLVPIALVLGFYRIFLGADQPAVVDPAPAFAQARTANAFPAREPANLPGGWRPISATFERGDRAATLRVGYVTPEGAGVQLVQSNAPGDTLVTAELSAGAQPQGPLELGGATWQRYVARVDERAVVLMAPGYTVIVVGDAAERELRDLAAALR